MSSPALRGSAEWSASREVALLLGLTRGNLHAAQQLWLRKERIKAEASQVASAGAPQASQQPAGCQAKPAPARAQAVPKPETAAQLARRERSQIRLRQKHLASKMWATIRIASRLLAWRRRVSIHLRLQADELGRKRAIARPVLPARRARRQQPDQQPRRGDCCLHVF